MNENAVQPARTYTLVDAGGITARRYELQHNGQTFLWVFLGRGGLFTSSPPITLRKNSAEGPIVSAAKYATFTHGALVVLGDPKLSPEVPWVELSRPMFGREYQFEGPDGRPYTWRRTRDPALGASKWRGMDYKLLDVADGEQLLAVFVKDKAIFGNGSAGRIDWMAQLEPNTELVVMTAIFMIQAQDQRRRRAGSASAAAGAC